MRTLLYATGGFAMLVAVNRRQPLSTNLCLIAASVFFFGATYSTLSGNQIRGGRADGRKLTDFDPVQLELGTRVELEHTGDPLLAREIATDHLAEDPQYYTKLTAAGL